MASQILTLALLPTCDQQQALILRLTHGTSENVEGIVDPFPRRSLSIAFGGFENDWADGDAGLEDPHMTSRQCRLRIHPSFT